MFFIKQPQLDSFQGKKNGRYQIELWSRKERYGPVVETARYTMIMKSNGALGRSAIRFWNVTDFIIMDTI